MAKCRLDISENLLAIEVTMAQLYARSQHSLSGKESEQIVIPRIVFLFQLKLDDVMLEFGMYDSRYGSPNTRYGELELPLSYGK